MAKIKYKKEPFEEAFEVTIGTEGGYANHPDDRGGETMFGITKETARAYGYLYEMKDLDIDTAKNIYKEQYWNHNRLPCEDIAKWSREVAMEAFDTGVNMGVIVASKMLQTSLNALNFNYKTREEFFPTLKIDGWFGKTSVEAMNLLDRDIDKRVAEKMMNCIQGMRYLAIMLGDDDRRRLISFISGVKSSENQKAFGRGWFERRIFSNSY